jgi:hypothetical protein
MEAQLLKQKKKELYKLTVARSDIGAAHSTCKLLLNTVKNLLDDLCMPLQAAIVISYARPFTKNDPYGALPEKWQRFSTPSHTSLHKKMLELRHKVIAHSDAEARIVHIYPPGFRISPDMVSACYGSGCTTFALPLDAFREFMLLSKDLGTRINDKIDQLLDEIHTDEERTEHPFELTF